MSRNEKLRKLGNAIRAYRGNYYIVTGKPDKWTRRPQPSQSIKIAELLMALGFDLEKVKKAINKIDNFKTIPEFEKWMKRKVRRDYDTIHAWIFV